MPHPFRMTYSFSSFSLKKLCELIPIMSDAENSNPEYFYYISLAFTCDIVHPFYLFEDRIKYSSDLD